MNKLDIYFKKTYSFEELTKNFELISELYKNLKFDINEIDTAAKNNLVMALIQFSDDKTLK